jgi:nicotinate-nucleotide adenylyltransferase
MIGIFGGTFDPIHYGHLRSALEVKEVLALSKLLLIPSAQPPHRAQPAASAAQRLQMLELAVSNHPELSIDARELNHDGPSYMVDTLVSLRQDYPQQPLLLLIGCDAFKQLMSWHQWQRLFDFAHIVVMTRPGNVLEAMPAYFKEHCCQQITELASTRAGKLYFQPVTALDISATAIRHMITQQQNPGFLLPDTVLAYIRQHQLYQRH